VLLQLDLSLTVFVLRKQKTLGLKRNLPTPKIRADERLEIESGGPMTPS
jgi:hypothetical protein